MDYICYPFGYLMKWCFDLVHDYGWAIILFTLATKIVMLPLSVWVHKNSIKIVKIQPEINFLKAKYFGDRERIAEEEAKLQRREHYSPLLSIIPLAIQIILLFAVLYIIKEPLTHVLHIEDGVCRSLADMIGVDAKADQLSIVRAVLDGRITASSDGAIGAAITQIQGFDLDFLGISLDKIASEVWGLYTLVPFVAAASAYLLCFVQNAANVIQAEQTKFNKYGMTVISVGLSLYLGFFVYTGVALYWVAGNVLAVIQQFILNAAISPKKYVDYERLEESRRELEGLRALGGNEKRDARSRANARREKADYKRFFKIVNKHVVFWSERSGFYKYYKALIEGLLSRSNLTIHYVTNDPDDAIFEAAKTEPRIKPYYIGQKKLVTLMMRMDADIVVMTTPDLQTYYIKRSLVRRDVEYIYVPHDMMSVHMGFRRGALDNFDTVFCTGPHVEREIRATERTYSLKEKTLVKFGYPLAETLEASCKAETHDSAGIKRILIAPSWQEDNLLDSCVDDLIESLATEGNHVTVRPHPEYSKRYPEKLRSLTEKYADYPKDLLTFELDFSTNRSIWTSDVLVTDWSGIAYEFAFATKHPVLFINTKMKVENPDWQEIGETPCEIYLRDKVGISLEKSDAKLAADAVKELTGHADEYAGRIEKIKNEHLFSYGSAGAEGVKYILTRLTKIQKKRKEMK